MLFDLWWFRFFLHRWDCSRRNFCSCRGRLRSDIDVRASRRWISSPLKQIYQPLNTIEFATNKRLEKKNSVNELCKHFRRVFPRSIYPKELFACNGFSVDLPPWHHERTQRKNHSLHDGFFIVRWKRTATSTSYKEIFHRLRDKRHRYKLEKLLLRAPTFWRHT